MTSRAYIIDAVRSPFARAREDGALHRVHPVDLYATVLKALVKRNDIDPALLDDVVTGCVIQVAEQAANIGRHAALAAGLPESVPGVTLDRKCGSSQQALDFAAASIAAGNYDLAIAGGVEMMGVVPMRVNRMGKDNEGPMLKARYPEGFIRQGISAELIAARWGVSREEMDEFSLRSHQLAAADEGVSRDIVPIETTDLEGHSITVTADEGIRANSTLAKLSSLKAAFESPEMTERYPEINWSVTAASSSQVTDGASAVLLASEHMVSRLNLKPRASIMRSTVAGDDPILMLMGIIPATTKLLNKVGLSVGDIGAFEVNEAFAPVVLGWSKEFDVELDQINVFGGAIALGHPVGASGGRLTANLLRAMESRKCRYGIQTMCESGGMANATLFEQVH
ncbi:MAG: thiolase family protein [Pseudomonadota bacterium]